MVECLRVPQPSRGAFLAAANAREQQPAARCIGMPRASKRDPQAGDPTATAALRTMLTFLYTHAPAARAMHDARCTGQDTAGSMRRAVHDVQRTKYSRRAAWNVRLARYPRQVYEQHRRGRECAHRAENGADEVVDSSCTDGANKGHCGEAAARTGTTSADWGTTHACDWRSGYSPCRQLVRERVLERVILCAIFSVSVRSAARQENSPMRCRDNALVNPKPSHRPQECTRM